MRSRGAQPDSQGDAPTAISLFSGGGGLDVGVASAGFTILACLEVDPHCCSTLRENQTESHQPKIVEADIRTINPSALMTALDMEVGDLDLLVGGPPCQTFSQIGKQKALQDPRGLLLFEMTRFAEQLQPRAILIEQVKGLQTARGPTGERGEVFEMLLDELSRLGYEANWQVLNAADYGVPQSRERLFIVGLLDGQFEFPQPTHSPSGESLFADTPHETVAAALRGLEEPHRRGHKSAEGNHVDVTPAGDQRRIHGVPEGAWLSAQAHLPPEQRGRLSRKDTTKFRRLAWDKPSLTLRCGEIFFHPDADRYLTPREYLALHGYPDDYRLLGPIRGRSGSVRNLDQHRQVANSVPPPLAKAIACEIMGSLTWESSSRYSAIQ